LGLFTKEKGVVNAALSIIWIISFDTFPDGFKGMLRGVIKALGI
jgi:Na+-driven multidrug efflux pump